jgi:hypothetical protein
LLRFLAALPFSYAPRLANAKDLKKLKLIASRRLLPNSLSIAIVYKIPTLVKRFYRTVSLVQLVELVSLVRTNAPDIRPILAIAIQPIK